MRSPLSLRWWASKASRTKGLIVVVVPLCAMLFSFVTAFLIRQEKAQVSERFQRSITARYEIDKLEDV